MGSVRDNGNGSFNGRWTDETGRRVEKLLPATSKREARAQVADMERLVREVRLGLSDGSRNLTIAEVHDRYAPVYRSQASWKSKAGRFRRILSRFGKCRLQEIRPADVERFLAELAKEGLSPQTREHHRIALSALYSFAIKKLRIHRGENPARMADRVAIPEVPPRFLEAHHVQAVLDHVAERWRDFFALAVYTGMRAGELRGLLVSSVDMERRIIFVWRSNERSSTKGRRMRIVPVPLEAMPYLENAMADLRGQWLFSDHRGRQLSRNTKLVPILKRALSRAGLVQGYDLKCRRKGCGWSERVAVLESKSCPQCGFKLWAVGVPVDLTFHELRKTHGTALAETTGGNLLAVQRIHGHSDPRVTAKRYIGATATNLVRVADKLSYKATPPADPTNTEKQKEEDGKTGKTEDR